MNHEVVGAVGSLVNLDEVVTATQSAQTAFEPSGVPELSIALQILKFGELLPFNTGGIPHIYTRRDIMAGRIKLLKVDLPIAQIDRVHATADVHTHHIGHDLVFDCHGCTNGTTSTGMYIRHDSDFTSLGKTIITHAPNLFNGLVFDHIGISNGRIDFSFNF